MKRLISLLALTLVASMLSSTAFAQTRTSQLVITNSTGTTKFSQTTAGLVIDNLVVLQRPGTPASTITLTVPPSSGNRNFAFPEIGGTLLTSSTNTFTGLQTFMVDEAQGNTLINSINAGNLMIDADRIDLTSTGVMLESNFLTTPPLTKDTTNGNITLGLANSGVTAGSYTNADITVDAFGRITAASNGAAGSGSAEVLTTSSIILNGNTQLSQSALAAATFFNLDPQNVDVEITLANGTTVGQMLVISHSGTSNAHFLEFDHSSNLKLPSNTVSLGRNDALSLIWSGVEWRTTALSNNMHN